MINYLKSFEKNFQQESNRKKNIEIINNFNSDQQIKKCFAK